MTFLAQKHLSFSDKVRSGKHIFTQTSFSFVSQASPERDDSCSEIPPYHGRIEMPEEPGDDVEESEMEMTRNYGNSLPKKDSNAGVVNKVKHKLFMETVPI